VTEQELDALYSEATRMLGELGEDKAALYLARLSLLLMVKLDDPTAIQAAIQTAREGI
jgi:hypothetical protein